MPLYSAPSSGGGASGPGGYESCRQLGTSTTATVARDKPRSHVAGQVASGQLTSITAFQGRVYGIPYWNETASTLTALQTAHPTAPTTVPTVVFGCYEFTSPTNAYPKAKVYASPLFQTSGAAAVFGPTGLNVALKAKTLYWVTFGSSVDTPVRGLPHSMQYPLLGRAPLPDAAPVGDWHPFSSTGIIGYNSPTSLQALPDIWYDDAILANFDSPAILVTLAPAP